jgi:DeoR family transcriptional regulator, fructose operon transcriptional repressor
MTDRFVPEREIDILKAIDERKRLTVPEMASMFEVSETTIRRHLDSLRQKGQILRTHGGALSLAEASFEDTLEHKRTVNLAEKRLIAREARARISDGDTILLGGGTTVLELARLMHDLKGATVLTNNVLAAAELYTNSAIDLCVCAGTVRDRTGVIVGRDAVAYFSSLRTDKSFVGADSISTELGITTPNSFEAEVERLLITKAGTSHVLADHTKMNRVSVSRQAGLGEFSCLITDGLCDPGFIRELREAGVTVVECRDP